MTNEELGTRLKRAREHAGLTQEAAARVLGLTRGALAQIELGMRAPNSLQLAKLADAYGQSLSHFLSDAGEQPEQDAVVALFRSELQLANDPARAEAVHRCARLAREYSNLEHLLGLGPERSYPVEYDVPSDGSRWDAIQQGERIAQVERDRLNLGEAPVRNIIEVLELQGLRVVDIGLPNDASGLFLNDRAGGLSIIVNRDHHPRRQLFSYAHEYCHVLCDRDMASLISKEANRSELREVRANAFAAAFLMPELAIRGFVRSLGKGGARTVMQVYDETEAISGQKRSEAGASEIQVYEVVQVAQHFGVSYDSMLYRLLNLGLVSKEHRARLAEQRDLADSIRRLLLPAESDLPRSDSKHSLLLLGLEALRRELISESKLHELADLAEAPDDFGELVTDITDRYDEERELLLPAAEKAGR